MVAMPKTPAEVTDTELAILDLLWERGPSQVRDIVEGLYPQHTPVLHATVKSLLERLTDKGFVECDRSRFAHKFAPRITREAYVGQQLRRHIFNSEEI
jgi:BlaI family transcriptional regulator, penicillinase repressor